MPRPETRQGSAAAEEARHLAKHLQALGMVNCGVERAQHATRWFAIHAPEVPCPLECHWTTLLDNRLGREPEVLKGYWHPVWIQEMHYALLTRKDAGTAGIHHNTPWTDGFLRVLVRCLADETFRAAAMTVARVSGRDAVFDLYQQQSPEGP